MTYCTYDTKCPKPIIIKKLIEEKEQLAKRICELQADLGRAKELVNAVRSCPFNICHNCEAECVVNK